MTATPMSDPHPRQYLAYHGTENARPPSAALDAALLERHTDGYRQGIEVLSTAVPKIQVDDPPVVRVGDGMRVPAVRVGDGMRVRG